MRLLKKPIRKVKTAKNHRVLLFMVAIFAGTGIIGYRLFHLAVIDHPLYVKSAQSQYANPSALLTGRGNIYAESVSGSGRTLLATNRRTYYAYADTRKVPDIPAASEKLSAVLNIPKETVLQQLSSGEKSYYVVSRNISSAQAQAVSALKIPGVDATSEISRFYPEGLFASHILGFVGFDGKHRIGQYGVESFYDDELNGAERTQHVSGNSTYSGIINTLFGGSLFTSSTASQSDSGQDSATLKKDGDDIVLTIDPTIQTYVEHQLDLLIRKWSAESGSILVQDPQSGAMLAVATSPSFDPNSYSQYAFEDFTNPIVQKIFEPGSTFKSITMAAAIDSKAVTPDTTYNDTGEVHFGSAVIKNYNEKGNGIQTMRQVLEHSLNTGAVFAETKTGHDHFLNYVVNFGFGRKTGVDLSGEVGGDIGNLYRYRDVNFATAAFGQGIAVTPLQLINAYSAIANGGKLMQPYVVKEIIHPDGSKTDTVPKIIDTPIKESTATQMKAMLADVVEKGFDKARVSGYDIAGKTGTAQIPDGKGGYLEHDQFIHDFAGFVPAYSPRFTMVIIMNQPKGIKFAADSLSPVFGEISRFLIHYFEIPPTKK